MLLLLLLLAWDDWALFGMQVTMMPGGAMFPLDLMWPVLIILFFFFKQ